MTKTPEPGQIEYEAWDRWLRGVRDQRPEEMWDALDVAERGYWASVERMNMIKWPLSQVTATEDPRGPHAGGIWRHVKSGENYRVLGIVRLEATNEPAVRYAKADGFGPEWVCSVTDWFADNGDGATRFGLVVQVGSRSGAQHP